MVSPGDTMASKSMKAFSGGKSGGEKTSGAKTRKSASKTRS